MLLHTKNPDIFVTRHVNKTIQYGNNPTNEEKLESINFNNMCKSKANDYDKTLITYDNDSKEKTSSTPHEED